MGRLRHTGSSARKMVEEVVEEEEEAPWTPRTQARDYAFNRSLQLLPLSPLYKGRKPAKEAADTAVTVEKTFSKAEQILIDVELRHLQNAATMMQKMVRGARARRAMFQQRMEVLSAVCVRWFRSQKLSYINMLLSTIRFTDEIGAALSNESERALQILRQIAIVEALQVEIDDARAQQQEISLEDARHRAYVEIAEADAAESKMEKELNDVEVWDRKVLRYKARCEELGRKYKIKPEEGLREDHADLYTSHKQYLGIAARAAKERQEYDDSVRTLERERREGDEALKLAEEEQRKFLIHGKTKIHFRLEKERRVLARKLTDPKTAVRERMRALLKSREDAPRVIVEKQGTGRTANSVCVLGVIRAGELGVYMGDFVRLKKQSDEDAHRAFRNAAGKRRGSTLTPTTLLVAMSEVGRKVNLDEAQLLVDLFDTNKDMEVDMDEFVTGLNCMVGRDLAHGLGVEAFQDGGRYEGEYLEDKRSGIGLYIAPCGSWYLGEWSLGVRHGKGLEGRTAASPPCASLDETVARHITLLPLVVAQCSNGVRISTDRFDPLKDSHRLVIRKMAVVVEGARKRAALANRLTAGLPLTTGEEFIQDPSVENKYEEFFLPPNPNVASNRRRGGAIKW